MLVKTMNQEEIAREILTDYPKVQKKAMYLTPSMRRAAFKSKSKHAFKVFEYKSPRKNNWLIFVDYYLKEPLFRCIVTYTDNHGFNAVMVNIDGSLNHYSSHFIQRYNERYLQQPELSKTEVFKRFMKRNGIGFFFYLPDDENQKNKFFGRLADGVALGYFVCLPFTRVRYLKTYINTEMAMEFQDNLLEVSSQELSEYWNTYYKFTKRDVFDSISEN